MRGTVRVKSLDCKHSTVTPTGLRLRPLDLESSAFKQIGHLMSPNEVTTLQFSLERGHSHFSVQKCTPQMFWPKHTCKLHALFTNNFSKTYYPVSVEHLKLFPFWRLRFDCLPFVYSELFTHGVKKSRHCRRTRCTFMENKIISQVKLKEYFLRGNILSQHYYGSKNSNLLGYVVFITSTPTERIRWFCHCYSYKTVFFFQSSRFMKAIKVMTAWKLESNSPFSIAQFYSVSLILNSNLHKYQWKVELFTTLCIVSIFDIKIHWTI